MNRINTASPFRAPGIRAAALAVLLFAVVGPQPAAAGPMALTYVEAAAWMRAERVGNRTSNVEQSGTAAEFTSNRKNQLTGRGVAGTVHFAGYAEPGHAVVATIDGTDYPVHRDGAYYYAAVPVDNSQGPVAAEVTVTVRGPGGETVRTESFTRLVPADGETWTYDLRGNKLSDSLHDYTWDELNRLIEVQVGAAVPEAHRVRLVFEYDAFGRRAVKRVYRREAGDWALEDTVKFVYAGWLLIAELDAADNLLRSYTWGRDLSGGLQGAGGIGGLMAVRDHAAGRTLWPVYDDRGNVTALVDAAEHTVLASIEYGPYGELLAVDAAPGAGIDRTNLAALCPLLFSTKYLDAELLPSGGLYYYGYRYYEPTSGKWLNRDPIAEAGGLNLYGFVGNDPCNDVDPLGLILFAFDGTDQDKDSGDPKTNVAKLWDAYIGAKVYIPGVGTRWRDSVKVGGSAWGHGVSRRVISKTALLDEYLAKQSRLPGGGDKNIDIVGFSRGAATARDFANKIQPILEKYRDQGVKIRFIGLFDTVPSIGYKHDEGNLRLGIPEDARAVTFHAVSAHERRKRFGLSRLEPRHGTEVWFPGVHANIGGGYRFTDLSDITLRWMATHAIRLGVPIDQTHVPNAVWWNSPGHESWKGIHRIFGGVKSREIPDNAHIHASLALWEQYYSVGKSTYDWRNAGFAQNRHDDPIHMYFLTHKNRTLNNDDRFLQRQRDARVDVFLDSFDKLRGPYRW